jgi:hypothetical protein
VQPQVDSGPRITFEKTIHDYGNVAPRSVSTAEFPFTNTGSAVLTFTKRPHSPCGCSVPELPKQDYAPGESGVITVRYTAPAGAKVDNYPITIFSNDPHAPQFELRIKASVEVNVAISPENVTLMLDADNAGMPNLEVTSTDGKEFSITSASSTNNAVRVPFDTTQKSTRFVLEPKVDMDKLTSTPNGVIQVRTNHPNTGLLTVRFSAKPLFEVSNPRIIIQNIVPGVEVVRDVWIRSNYDKKVKIESFESTNGYMSIATQRPEGNHLEISVKIKAPADAAASSRRYITDELKIQLADGNALSIRCSGWFKLN